MRITLLGHGFYATNRGIRYTRVRSSHSEPAPRQVLGWLLDLNHARRAASIQCASAQLAVTDAGFQPAGRRSRGCVAMQRGFGNVRRAGRRKHAIIGYVLFSGDAAISGAKTAGVGAKEDDNDTGFGRPSRQRKGMVLAPNSASTQWEI
jgi:hypothetical protein